EDAIIVAGRTEKIKQHSNCCRRGQHDEEPAAERAAFLQLAEGDAAILSINQVEHAANDRAILKAQATNRPGFARLIRQIDADRRDEVARAPGHATRCDTSWWLVVHSIAALPPRSAER